MANGQIRHGVHLYGLLDKIDMEGNVITYKARLRAMLKFCSDSACYRHEIWQIGFEQVYMIHPKYSRQKIANMYASF